MLPNTLTPKLIKTLNVACDTFSEVCNCVCDDVGWCQACWVFAAEEPDKRKEMTPDEEGLRKVND